eukprot:235334-Hanusia_phi.AAC.2
MLRVQLRSKTEGVRIYYAFNSHRTTPRNFALEGGRPMKEEPYGTGRGKVDGSAPLRDEVTGRARPNKMIAGVVENFGYVDVTTSGILTAFAAKVERRRRRRRKSIRNKSKTKVEAEGSKQQEQAGKGAFAIDLIVLV